MSTRPGAPVSAPVLTNTVTAQLGSSRYAPLAASSAFGKVMSQAVAAICVGNGFDTADPDVLELLTHAASAYMKEISEGAQIITENSGRTKLIPADVWLSLVNMGQNVSQLPDFLTQQLGGRSIVIAPPKPAHTPHNPIPLRVGSARIHHPHIHDFFPPFPDPHTYVRSEISLEPDQSYERARELLALKKREAESSLSDFFLRTHQSTCVFREMEGRIRTEARSLVEGRAERDSSRRMQRRAMKRKRGGEIIDGGEMRVIEELPESLLEEDERRQNASGSPMEDNDDDELLLEILDTESSIVRRKIPAHCFVLDPTHEHRPYLSALMGDLNEEEMEKTEAKLKVSRPIARLVVDGDGRGERNGENGSERPTAV